MSRNRRQPKGHGPIATWRTSMHKQKEKAEQRSLAQEAKSELEGGDCSKCGWITAMDICPNCGSVVLDEAQA